MNPWPRARVWVVLGSMVAGCPTDDGSPPQGPSSGEPTVGTVSTSSGVGSVGSAGSVSTGSTTEASTGPGSASSTAPSSDSMTTSPVTTDACDPQTTGNADTGDLGYAFATTSYCDYTQMDRVGYPLVTSLLIESDADYNGSSPAEDLASFVFLNEMNTVLQSLHPALDAALTDAGFVPCTFGTCNAQLVPRVIPDVLTLDPAAADAFPNGRRLDEPILDLVLAVLLLDLGVEEATAFVDAALGPPANDVAFSNTWPYVSPPH